MAKRYFNIFRSHIAIFTAIIAFICASEFTTGIVATIAKILAGILLIYAAISYSLWLLKSPSAKPKD